MTNNSKKVANWLLVNDHETNSPTKALSNEPKSFAKSVKMLGNHPKWRGGSKTQAKHEPVKVAPKLPDSLNKKTHARKSLLASEIEETELTKSPISGTYIIKDWHKTSNLANMHPPGQSRKHTSSTSQNRGVKVGFSKNEVELNSIAASFVEITPQSRAKLQKIPNKIGPYECKLCKFVYKDAFELAMHNCPRVVNIEYKYAHFLTALIWMIFNCTIK